MNLKLHIIKVCPKLLLGTFLGQWLTHPPTKVSVSRQQSITMTAVTKLLIMMTVTQKMHPAAVPTPMNISLAMIASVSQLPYFLYQIAFVSLFQYFVVFFFRQIAHHQLSSRCVFMMSCDMADLLWPPRYMPILMASLYTPFSKRAWMEHKIYGKIC